MFSVIRQTALYRTYVRRRVRFDEFGTVFESLLSVSKKFQKFFDTLKREAMLPSYFIRKSQNR